jgi:hypothetical protein
MDPAAMMIRSPRQGRAVHRNGVRIGEPRLAEDDLGSGPRERRRQRLERLDDLVLPADAAR